MHPIRPPIPPKPRLPGVPHIRDFRDSGISISDDRTASTDSLKRTINTFDTVSTPATPSAVRQLASQFETIARLSNPNIQRSTDDRSKSPPVPRKPSTTVQMQELRTKIEHTLTIAPKPHSLPTLPSSHDRTKLSRRASAIAERIYDTVYERDHTGHHKHEPPEVVYEELDDPTLTDGYSSFESSTDDEDVTDEGQNIKNNYYYSITPELEAPEYDTIVPVDHIRKVIAELIEKEQKYIETLDQGIRNYVPAMYAQTLPAALRGLRNIIFINLEQILRLHRDDLLPDLERAANSSATASENSDQMAEKIAEVFLSYIENERFYCYVQFAMHQADSESLRLRYHDYFLKIQHDLDDKLGLNSLLLQPIQRLPRYKLLLNEMVKNLLTEGDGKRTMSRRTALLCKVDKRLSLLIDRVNQAINIHDIRQCGGSQLATNSSLKQDIPLTLILQPEGNRNPARDTPINLLYQGKFQRLFLVDIYDTNVRRKYGGKLFAFEKLLLYVEIQRDRLEYRGHFSDSEVCYLEEGKNRLILYAGPRGTQEIIVQSDTNTELQPLVALVYTMAKAVIYDSVEIDDRTPSDIVEEVEDDQDAQDPTPSEADDNWDEHKLTSSLIEAQQQFLEVLKANQRFYLDTLSVDVKSKLTSFISAFEAIMELHQGILQDLTQPHADPDKVCQCFDRYLKTDVFDPYYDYLREFRKATKWIQHSQTPSNFNNRVASTVKQFTFLCIEHMQEYSRYFEVLIVKYSENSTLNIPIDTELFQRLAYVLVHLNTYRNNLAVNYELFLIDENAPACGMVCHSERVTLINPPLAADTGPCRLFVCEKAAICVKVQDVSEDDQQVERFVRVLFFDRFQGRGVPMRMRKSKRELQRLNFLINGFKFRMDFDSTQAQSTFYSSYVNRYIMI